MFHGLYDRSPALMARCAGVDDVVAAVRLAVDRGLELSVYSGGHSVTGSADSSEASRLKALEMSLNA